MNVIPIRRSLMPALMLVSASCSKPQQPAQPVPGASSGSTTANTLTDGERAAGWKLLFDGRTGAGWRGYRQQTLPAGWQVKDGALTRVAEAGDIITDEQFKNFELALEWKISPGGNSGIFYRASEDSDAIYWNAPEIQVLDDARHPDGQSRMTAAGAAYDLYPSPAGIVKPANEWNAVRLVVNGNHVEQWLNGVKVVEYEFGSPDFQAKVKDSKFAPHPNFGRNSAGHIGLQDHGDVVAFRNIKIRVLP